MIAQCEECNDTGVCRHRFRQDTRVCKRIHKRVMTRGSIARAEVYHSVVEFESAFSTVLGGIP
jgi:hypothetical protein